MTEVYRTDDAVWRWCETCDRREVASHDGAHGYILNGGDTAAEHVTEDPDAVALADEVNALVNASPEDA